MENQNLFLRALGASNEELFASVERLTLTEHGVLVKVLVLLGEIDRRGIYRERAWPSLFEYCVSHLHYSEGQACRRIAAARALQKFPSLFDLFEKREITLTNLAKVSRLLTEKNHVELAKAVGTKRKDETERVLASWFPQPDVKPLVRQLPTPQPTPKPAASPIAIPLPLPLPLPIPIPIPSPSPIPLPTASSSPPASQPAAPSLPSPAAASTTRGRIHALSEKRYGVHFTIDENAFQQLEHAQQMTKHRGEAGSLENLMKRAIALLHEELERERLGKTSSRRQSNPRPMKDAGAISRSTKRAVFERDEEQCTFREQQTQRRCPSKTHLEIDHIHPRSKGGKATLENLRLRCRAHNRLAAENSFGRIFIERKIASNRRSRTARHESSRTRNDD